MNKQSKTHLIVDLADCKEFISAAGLNEKQCRLFYGFLSSEIGGERQAVLAKTLGVSLQTVKKGKSEFSQKESVNTHRIRKAGAGRKKIAEQCPEFQRLLVSLLEPPELSGCALVWTTLSLRKIQAIAKGQNISVSHSVISKEIAKAGFLKKSHHKMLQVLKASPSREEQFAFINEEIKKYIAEGQPVISINCEKQEIKDSFKVCGTDVPKKSFDETAYEEAVNQASNIALYRLFSDDKTEEFAAQGCYGWWKIIGEKNYPGAHKFLIICAGGGETGIRNRLWKWTMAKMAEKEGLEIEVCLLPPGTYKWRNVLHTLVCFSSKSNSSETFVETVVEAVACDSHMTLNVSSDGIQPLKTEGIDICKEKLKLVDIAGIGKYKDWNYVIRGYK